MDTLGLILPSENIFARETRFAAFACGCNIENCGASTRTDKRCIREMKWEIERHCGYRHGETGRGRGRDRERQRKVWEKRERERERERDRDGV